MRWHKEAYGSSVQTNIESIKIFENIGAVVSSKLKELRKSPTGALVYEILYQAAYCINNCY